MASRGNVAQQASRSQKWGFNKTETRAETKIRHNDLKRPSGQAFGAFLGKSLWAIHSLHSPPVRRDSFFSHVVSLDSR